MFVVALSSINSMTYRTKEMEIKEFVAYTKFLSVYEAKHPKTVNNNIYLIELSSSGKILKKIPPSVTLQVEEIRNLIQRAFSGETAYKVDDNYLYVATPTEKGIILMRKPMNAKMWYPHPLLYISLFAFVLLVLHSHYVSKKHLKELQSKIKEARTDAKRTKLKLYRFYVMLSTLLNRAGFILLMISPNGNITYFSKPAKEIFHAEKGFFWEKLQDIELKKAIKKSIDTHEEVRSKTQLNGRNYTINCLPTGKHRSKPIIVNITDVTEKEELARSNSELIGDIAHELKTPLSVMKGYIEILKDTLQTEHSDILEKLDRRTEQLNQIIDSILTLHRIELSNEGERVIYLPGIIEEVYDVYRNRATSKGLKVEQEIKDRSFLYIKGAPTLLRIALSNILDNAIKYTHEGKILIRGFYKDGYINIEVQDTGTGIPHEELNRIFNRFHVVSQSREKGLSGTGIGLSVTKSIVQRHKGKIYVESKLGVGSKFTILLPPVPSSEVSP